jgi:hypothetical protein
MLVPGISSLRCAPAADRAGVWFNACAHFSFVFPKKYVNSRSYSRRCWFRGLAACAALRLLIPGWEVQHQSQTCCARLLFSWGFLKRNDSMGTAFVIYTSFLFRKPHEKTRMQRMRALGVAEREGFEPPVPCGTSDFESDTFDHSDTFPGAKVIIFDQRSTSAFASAWSCCRGCG